MPECRRMVITLVSATNFSDVRDFGEMKVYAKVSIEGETRTSKKTPKEGKTNPRWNFPIEFIISKSAIQQPGIKLAVKRICKRTCLEDMFVTQVSIPIKSLFDRGLKIDRVLSYQVDGTRNGRLNILYSFGDEKIFVRKASLGRSGWKDVVGIGFLVLLGGTLLLLGDKCVDESDDVPALPAISRKMFVWSVIVDRNHI